jgi:hypothetical protein
MHGVGFWKGQGFSNEAGARLSQSVIPTFHMIRMPASFANALVCFLRKDELIRFPEIAITLATFVFLWNLLPQLAAGCLTSITDHKSHDLTGSAAHNRPDPAFVPSFVDKWPHFIGFQDVFGGFGWQKRVFKFRIGLVFFLARMPESDDSRQRSSYAAHTRAFMVGWQDLFFLRFAVSTFRFKNTAFSAVFAPVLLTAAGIVTVFHDVLAVTISAFVVVVSKLVKPDE